MRIEYQFNADKAVAAMARLVSGTGPTDKLKLVKLLYLSDRDCFLKHGHPITGDQPVAMDHGPVPSGCLDVLNGQIQSDVFSFLHVQDKTVTPERNPSGCAVELSEHESKVLQDVLDQYGWMSTSQLYRLVHDLPEYKECHVPGTSTPIPFEKILKHHGTEDQYRNGRAVITREMRKHLICPFPRSEPPI